MRTILSAVLLAMVGLGQLVAPPAAVADVTTLCRGYVGCGQQGMSDAGYGRASGAMYWRMYSGHNCTNYAAFRMVQSGLPNVRPWTGGGNATYWGTSMAHITDNVPAVGSIAWWKAGVYPAGSAGHVAYVEKVVDADTIIVSQDSWGGDFSWAKITRGSRGWPSGFIHFNDATPAELTLTKLTAPKVSGTAKVGSTLTATPGTWSPTAGVTYQWRSAGVDIAGATKPTLTVGEAQLGKRIRVRVTATRTGYSTATARSARTSRVRPGTLTSTAAPRIDGDPVVDGTLTAVPGTWTPTAASLTYRWLADGVPIEGATAQTFAPDAALLGARLAVEVTASRAGYTDATATSPVTAPVAEAVLVATDPVLSGTPRLGEVLQVSTGATSPAGAPTVQWLRDGRVVRGASGSSYELSAEDLGAQISALVKWGRPGYQPLETRSGASRVVKEIPAVDVSLLARRDEVRMSADVATAAGVLPDQVRVRIGRTLQTVPLVEGTASVVVAGLRPGTRTVKVVVPAGSTTARVLTLDEVTVP